MNGSIHCSNNLLSVRFFDREIAVHLELCKRAVTWVMLGANTIAMLRAFILLTASSCTTSAIKLMAQSSSAAWVGGRSFTNATVSSSVWHSSTCSGVKTSRTPCGNSLNQACDKNFQTLAVSSQNLRKPSRNWREKVADEPNFQNINFISYDNCTRRIISREISHDFKITLISPARQCRSMSIGTTPLLSWSLTCSWWLFSALILKMPSACHIHSII